MPEDLLQATVMASDPRWEKLLRLLATYSFQYSDEPVFTLASGRKSHYYINCKTTTFRPEAMPLVGALLFERIRDLSPDAVGGLTLGADPLAYAVAYHSTLQGQPIHAFSVRKEPKEYGIIRWVEGYEKSGARVVILEDVITTGESTLKAIRGAKEAQFAILKVVALVDRQEGGRERIEAAGFPFEALYLRDHFMALLKK